MNDSRHRDEAYLTWVRTLPCVVCGRSPCEPHHQALRGHGAMGLKPSDYRTLPLCGGVEGHHTGRGTAKAPGSVHTVGRSFWGRHGIDVERAILGQQLRYFFACGG